MNHPLVGQLVNVRRAAGMPCKGAVKSEGGLYPGRTRKRVGGARADNQERHRPTAGERGARHPCQLPCRLEWVWTPAFLQGKT